MTKNFRVRTTIAILFLVLGALFLFVLDGILFKIAFCLFAIMAIIELFSFFKHRKTALSWVFAILELIFLICGTFFIIRADVTSIILLIVGVCSYDVFAYLFGSFLGGKIFKKSRPFPFVSKNKTWEGTIFGILSGILVVIIALLITQSYQFVFLLAPLLALVGDLFESYTKRLFSVKDSNEIIIKNSFFQKIELVVGGSEGHGGFLDRIDSTVFSATIILILLLCVFLA